MNKALLREHAIFGLWEKRISAGDETTQQILDDLKRQGYVVSENGSHALTSKGLEFVLNSRSQEDLVELLQGIEMRQEERFFLANAIKSMVDKPFAYEIIKAATSNPNRLNYPSVDLGAYEDIAHGVLFRAGTHIMIDPLIGKRTIDDVLQKINDFGAVITEEQQKGYGAHVLYEVGETKRELYIVGTEAMKIDINILKRRIEPGIFALMMKGLGGKKERFGDVFGALEHYSGLLIEGGFLLTAKTPKLNLKKIREGMLSYESHVYDGPSGVVMHSLYQKPAKG